MMYLKALESMTHLHRLKQLKGSAIIKSLPTYNTVYFSKSNLSQTPYENISSNTTYQQHRQYHSNILSFFTPVNYLLLSQKSGFTCHRLYSASAKKNDEGERINSGGAVADYKGSEIKFSDLSTSQKAKQVSSDTFYTGIVIAGIALTGYIFYCLGMELFSTQTPNGLYNLAYKKAIKDDKVISTLGTPIKAYGEMSRRGRRQHVRSSEYTQDDGNKKVMNIEFHLEGSIKKATVLAEAVAVAGGKYELKRVVMRVDTYPNEVVTVVDER